MFETETAHNGVRGFGNKVYAISHIVPSQKRQRPFEEMLVRRKYSRTKRLMELKVSIQSMLELPLNAFSFLRNKTLKKYATITTLSLHYCTIYVNLWSVVSVLIFICLCVTQLWSAVFPFMVPLPRHKVLAASESPWPILPYSRIHMSYCLTKIYIHVRSNWHKI